MVKEIERRLCRRTLLGLAALAAAGIAPARAESLAPPTGAVLLTVTGEIAHTTAPGRAEFDRAALDALGRHEIKT